MLSEANMGLMPCSFMVLVIQIGAAPAALWTAHCRERNNKSPLNWGRPIWTGFVIYIAHALM